MSNPNTAYIETHELFLAYQAVCLDGAGKGELTTLAHYDVDPLDPNAEDLIVEIISDQVACEFADNSYKVGRAA